MPQSMAPAELFRLLANGHSLTLLDVRQPWEHELAALPGSLLIPLPELPKRMHELAHANQDCCVVYCHHGVRSWQAARILEANGWSGVYSLTGGIDAWSMQVDPLMPRY